jgi:mRNA-degrading endonuclease RelE of RelBE toxin-antitoxin system
MPSTVGNDWAVYKIELIPRARRELDKIPIETFNLIDEAIWKLRQDPRPHGTKKLKGSIHRIRVGRWCIIYAVFDKDKLVIIGKVAKRAENTYDEVEGLFRG